MAFTNRKWKVLRIFFFNNHSRLKTCPEEYPSVTINNRKSFSYKTLNHAGSTGLKAAGIFRHTGRAPGGFMFLICIRNLKTLSIGILVCFWAFPAYSVSDNIKLTPEEKKYLAARGPIVFISQENYPPFEFRRANGVHDGMMIELARWMSSEIGFRTRFVDTNFAAAQEAVRNGEADILTSLFYSEKRDRDFDFTETIFAVPASIFVLAERPDIAGLEDLNGKTIAIQRGDYAREFLESRGIRFETLATHDFAEATRAVIRGEADAVIGDEQIVLYDLFDNNLTDRGGGGGQKGGRASLYWPERHGGQGRQQAVAVGPQQGVGLCPQQRPAEPPQPKVDRHLDPRAVQLLGRYLAVPAWCPAHGRDGDLLELPAASDRQSEDRPFDEKRTTLPRYL